ncbi:MAG: oligosaccharide flippase family protein [Candidatus Aminicenantes bacterium]|nr:oligosaccharide flippase family protein [Candidatus Aminicenantes bacterium]
MSRIASFWRRIAPRGSFRADVLTLMTGTALGQALLLAIAPLLTRLFSPAAFGAFGVYLSLAAIMSSVSTLRFDQALMLPAEEEEAASLLGAALLASTATALAVFVAVQFGQRRALTALRIEALGGWILVLPLSVLTYGVFQALNSWAVRHKEFTQSSAAQGTRALAIAAVQLGSGVLRSGPGGLVVGAAAGDAVGAALLAARARRHHGGLLRRSFRWRRIVATVRDYRDFPMFSTPQNLLNAVSQHLPLLLLAKFFGPAVAGFYVLAVRSVQTPMNLFLTSLRQAFFQKASELHNRGGDTWSLFRLTTLHLLAMAALPTLAVVLFGPSLFAFVLGGRWLTAGAYARWLVLWQGLMFANVPAVFFAQVLRKQKEVLLVDVVLLFARALAIVAGGLRRDPLLGVILYSLVGVAVNLFMIAWVGRLLWRGRRR